MHECLGSTVMDPHPTYPQSRHGQQLSSLKWRRQGDAIAVTQPANSVL